VSKYIISKHTYGVFMQNFSRVFLFIFVWRHTTVLLFVVVANTKLPYTLYLRVNVSTYAILESEW